MQGKLPQRKIIDHGRGGLLLLRQPDRAWPPGMWRRSTTPATSAKRMEIGAVVGAAPGRPTSCRDGPASGRRRHPARRHAPAGTAAAARPAPPRPTPSPRSRPAARRCRRATRPIERKLQRLFRDREVTRMIKPLQRLRRGRRVGGDRRAGRRPAHQPRRGPQEVRRPGRHRAGDLRIPGAHGRRASRRRTWTTSSRRAHARKPRGDRRRRGHRGTPPA